MVDDHKQLQVQGFVAQVDADTLVRAASGQHPVAVSGLGRIHADDALHLTGGQRGDMGNDLIGHLYRTEGAVRHDGSDPLHVGPGTGIDADHIALIDEEGHVEREPGLYRGRLATPGRRVALEPG